MTQRRVQNPTPEIAGRYWQIRPWKDITKNGVTTRKRIRVRLGLATLAPEIAQQLADAVVKPLNEGLNQGLVVEGEGTNFGHFVKTLYKEDLEKLSSTTQSAYSGEIERHILPYWGGFCFKEITRPELKSFFSDMARRNIGYPTIVKTRDAMSSILRSAMEQAEAGKPALLETNPLFGVKLPKDKRLRRQKAIILPKYWDALIALIAEPYATMVYLAIWTGLRPSEISALTWHAVAEAEVFIEARYTRGNLARPKTDASEASIPILQDVFDRINRLKNVTFTVKAGLATRTYRAVKSDGPDDLVFQAVQEGGHMDYDNILKRHIKPAAIKLQLLPARTAKGEFTSRITWQALRRTHATFLSESGADPKSIQALLRHADPAMAQKFYVQARKSPQMKALVGMQRYVKEQQNLVPLTDLVPLVQ
jgi:integrase